MSVVLKDFMYLTIVNIDGFSFREFVPYFYFQNGESAERMVDFDDLPRSIRDFINEALTPFSPRMIRLVYNHFGERVTLDLMRQSDEYFSGMLSRLHACAMAVRLAQKESRKNP